MVVIYSLGPHHTAFFFVLLRSQTDFFFRFAGCRNYTPIIRLVVKADNCANTAAITVSLLYILPD